MAYDEAVKGHYDRIAAADGLNPASTMQDDTVRNKETDAIKTLVGDYAKSKGKELSFVDIGCGNGFTVRTLRTSLTAPINYQAFEPNDMMRGQAEKQLAGLDKVTVSKGDIRDAKFAPANTYDILLSQRVIINILDLEHQKTALQNLIKTVKPGGLLIFIEAFQPGLDYLNEARAEQGIEPLPPAFHNLYLPGDFFDSSELKAYPGDTIGEHFLSTHYYVSRVLHPAWLDIQKKDFIRNSYFVKFFSSALQQGVGQFAPLRLRTYLKA